MNPTTATYAELQKAYEHFNRALFGGALPDCLITLQRKKRTYGYFAARKFVSKGGNTTDEIAMNPGYFAICPPEEVLQTLVHEMAHLWQFHFGQPGRRGYHNREWAKKMESIGLMPSNTGEPGGKKTGEQMMDYIIEGGAFEDACKALLTANFCLSWADRFPARERLQEALEDGSITELTSELEAWGVQVSASGALELAPEEKPTRAKFSCPGCDASAWGKPSLKLICGECNISLERR